MFASDILWTVIPQPAARLSLHRMDGLWQHHTSQPGGRASSERSKGDAEGWDPIDAHVPPGQSFPL